MSDYSSPLGHVDEFVLKPPLRVWWTLLFLLGYPLRKIPSWYQHRIERIMVDQRHTGFFVPTSLVVSYLRAALERGSPHWRYETSEWDLEDHPEAPVIDAIRREYGMSGIVALHRRFRVHSTYYFEYGHSSLNECGSMTSIIGCFPVEQQHLQPHPRKQYVYDWALRLKRVK